MLKKLALILALLTLFSACAMAEPDTDALLMDAANRTIEDFMDVCSLSNYFELFYSGSGEISDLAAETLACSYASPTRAAVLKLNSDGIEALLRIALKAGSADKETLLRIQLRVAGMLPSTLNGGFGSTWLAVSSVLTHTDVIQLDNADPGVFYVVYEYADPEQPMLYVSFSVKSDGLALVNAGFLKTSDEWKAQLFSDGGANLSDALGDAAPMVQGVLRSFLTQTIYDFSEKP